MEPCEVIKYRGFNINIYQDTDEQLESFIKKLSGNLHRMNFRSYLNRIKKGETE